MNSGYAHVACELTDLGCAQPLLLAGDFNVDNHTFAAEVAELTELLGAGSPVPIGDQQFTSE